VVIVFSSEEKGEGREERWTCKQQEHDKVLIQTLSKDSAYLMTIVSVVVTPRGGVIGRYPILV
jgi:hypothetical protein